MEESDKKNSINTTPAIHTYSGDMASVVRNDEVTVIKVALAEKKKREQEGIYKEAEGTKTQKFFWVFGGILLIIISVGGAYLLYHKKNVEIAAKEQPTPKIETLISYDASVTIDATNATGTDLSNLLYAPSRSQEAQAPSSIKSIFLIKKTLGENGPVSELLTTQDFLRIIDTHAPGDLVSSLSKSYMLGTYAEKKTGDPHVFLVFQTKKYEQTFSNLPAWEKGIVTDFAGLFSIDTGGSNKDIATKAFQDTLINNKNARVLYDDAGKPLLYYLFVDNTTFVVTDSTEAVSEITARLLTKNAKTL
jgi:hypothetical protein